MATHRNAEARLSWPQVQAASDAELVRLLKSGNDDALAVVVDRYQRLVLSVALRIVKNECEAEDVVQTVFVDIFRKLGQFDASRGTLKMWLLQYAYSRSLNRRHYLEQRQFYSRLDIHEVEPFLFSVETERHDGLSSRETGVLIKQAIGALNPKQQTAIELIYFEGLTLEEAAQKTGGTLPAVRHHYYRGLVKLREFVNQHRPQTSDAPQPDGIRVEVAHLRPRTI